MSIRRELPEGSLIPRGYGVAWVAIDRASIICLPVPLNVVACWLRVAYRWLRFPPGRYVGAAQIVEAESRAYQNGRDAENRMHQYDREEQYRRGLDAGRAEMRQTIVSETMALLRAESRATQ